MRTKLNGVENAYKSSCKSDSIHSDVNQKFKLNALFIQHKPDFGASKTLNA